MTDLPDRFEHADKAIYSYKGKSSAEFGKIYDILDHKVDNFCKLKLKIEPGWYSINSFYPYYDVEEGDILVSTRRAYIGTFIPCGMEFEIISTHVSIGYLAWPRGQVMTIDTSDIHTGHTKYHVSHKSFKPVQRTIRKKVKLI